jgi:hypothetical protein
MSSKLMIVAIAMLSNLSIANADVPATVSLPTSTTVSQDETYIGAIRYEGGLVERAVLTLESAMDLRFVRFEVPNFCQADIFAAGTITEGVADHASATGVPGVYAVADGRGARVRSIFASLNGPDTSKCHVLVYARSSASLPSRPELPPTQPYKAVTCIINELSIPFVGRILTDNIPTDLSIAPRMTTILVTTPRPDRSVPFVQLSYDMDMSLLYTPASAPLASQLQAQPGCLTAPTYVLRQRGFSSLIDLFRVQ